VKQGFVKHFQNLNLKLVRIGIHGLIELEDLYHEMVRILDRFNKQICRDNKIKMRIQTVVDVIPISIAHVQSQLQQNNIGITYARTSNFRMDPVRYVPLYFVAMPQSIITVIEAPFVLAPIITIGSIKSRPHTLRGTKFVNLHKDFPKEVNKVFINQPSYQGRGNSNP
jgi:hypothetical protein